MSRLTLGLIALFAAAASLPIHAADTKAESKWEKTIKAFEEQDKKNTPPENAVLFIGSSSIRMWKSQAAFPDLPVINRGFGGSQTSDVNAFVNRIVIPYKPRVIAFYCGDNDIAAKKSVEQVVKDFAWFFQTVRKSLPETEVLFLPIKPSRKRWTLWPAMAEVNEKIRGVAEKTNGLTYVDTATPMLATGEPPAEDLFLSDGLHMTEKGYAMWNKVLRPHLDAALKP